MKLVQVIALTGVVSAIAISGGRVAAEGTQFRETITVTGGRTPVYGGNDHVLTFSSPVALPGVALGAGTYLFKRPAANVLLVFAPGGRGPLAMVNAVTAKRTTATHAYQIVLRRAPRNDAPPRIEAWFAAGEAYGQELVYGDR